MNNELGVPDPSKTRKQDILIVTGAFLLLCICVAAVAGGAAYLQSIQLAQATAVNQTREALSTLSMQTQVAHNLEATTTHSALATERAGYDFFDGFDANLNGWPTGGEDNDYWSGAAFFEYGVYSWKINLAKKGFVSWRVSNNIPVAADFDLYVDVRRYVGSTSDLSYGLQFRRTPVEDGSSYYAFAIRDDGYYRLLFRDGQREAWTTLIPWTFSGTIVADKWNTLGVSARGPQFTLTINDQVVSEYSDDRVDRGGIGLFIDMSADQGGNIWFDNLAMQLR